MTLAGAATGRNASVHLDALERRLEVVDVALQLGLPGVGDRPDAYRLDRGRNALAGIELGVELGELLAVDAAGERIGARLDRPPLEAAQALQHVLRPADRFAELAVADDVDADLGLLAHDLGDRLLQALVVSRLVVRLAGLLGAQKFLQRRRPDEAADMGGEDAVGTALH